ncbi:MAG: dihydrolipoyl dehydrogenase [Desulfomonilaceae bacterium]|nr:dihydrolipoyl dehydrogenase [Desulfomonilaceae bacterium]
MNKERVLVVGGGVGGYPAALRAARLGANVTLIEKEKIGGVCLNKGCIPTKVLLHCASLYEEFKRASIFGLITDEVRIDYGKVSARKNAIVARLAAGVKSLLNAKNVSMITGTAVFRDSNRLEILETGEVLTGDKIILATGSVPAQLPVSGNNDIRLLTSDDLLTLEEPSRSLLIVGGGYIGVELGQFFGRMGVDVTIVEMLDRVVPTEDAEIGKALEASLSKEGIKILTRTTVKSIEKSGGDKKVILAAPDGVKEIVVSEVAQTIGRRPNCSGMNVERIGLRTEMGRIPVNDKMQTNVPHVYAVGDVIGGIMLAHVAMAEGECAARNAMGVPNSMSYRAVPRCVYTSPEVACVGLTEQAAVESRGAVQIGRFPLHAVGKAALEEQTDGMIKIVADKRHDEVLGVHIIGPHATELIAEAVLAIEMEATVEELAHAIHPHPTVSEGIGEAAMMLAGGAVHLP